MSKSKLVKGKIINKPTLISPVYTCHDSRQAPKGKITIGTHKNPIKLHLRDMDRNPVNVSIPTYQGSAEIVDTKIRQRGHRGKGRRRYQVYVLG